MNTEFDTRASDPSLDLDAAAPCATPTLLIRPEVADRLLDLLASDDGFRALFERDARSALWLVGHETPAADRALPGRDPVLCLASTRTLASKEAIQAARADIRDSLVRLPFSFEITSLGGGR